MNLLTVDYSLDELTEIQKKKWCGFLQKYPDFCRVPSRTLELTSAEISKALLSKSCNVIRDLERISRRLNHILRIQEGTKDSRNNFIPLHPLLNPRRDARKRGRQKGCHREQGFRGNAICIRLWIADK